MEEKPHYKGRGRLTESMRKHLTKAARCAIKMRSMLNDKREAAKLLREDLRNGPFHCFGDHSHCSTDYCKVTQRAVDELTDLESTQSSDTTTTAGTDSDADVQGMVIQEQTMWEDALSEENLDDMRSIPPSSQLIDKEMMCDIQRLVSRLIAKAPQLIGEKHTCMNVYR